MHADDDEHRVEILQASEVEEKSSADEAPTAATPVEPATEAKVEDVKVEEPITEQKPEEKSEPASAVEVPKATQATSEPKAEKTTEPAPVVSKSASEPTPAPAAEKVVNDAPVASDDFNEFKKIAQQIIQAEISNPPVVDKKKLTKQYKDIVLEIEDTKFRLTSLDETLIDIKNTLPRILHKIESSQSTTDESADILINNAITIDKLYEDIAGHVEAINNDPKSAPDKIKAINEIVEKIQALIFESLSSLEFQDITEQTLKIVINSLNMSLTSLSDALGIGVPGAEEFIDEEKSVIDQSDIDSLFAN